MEWDPMRADEIPPGWYVSDVAPDRLVYRWHDFDLALEATRIEAEDAHPVLGVTYCWELQLCYSIGECFCVDRLTCVPTRAQLEEEIESCLEALQRKLSETPDPVAALRELRTDRDD